MNLIATFPKDRSNLGTLQAWIAETLLETFPCLGKADNLAAAAHGNPTRDPLRPYGDTPTGTWKVNKGVIQKETRSYGPHPVFVLWPTGGQALKSYGPGYRRNGIWLHGGAIDKYGNLRPTHGCPRVHNETMARLHELSSQYGPITTLETKEGVNV